MGQALATSIDTAIPAKQERISGRIRIAVDAMVLDALPRAKAAAKAGISEHGLYKALRKPPTMAYMRAQMQMLRESAASRTIAKAEKLMDEAASEHVQADMTKWLAGLEGIAPVQRIENTHIHRNTQPGLVMNFIVNQPDGVAAQVIDGQAHQVEGVSVINGLPIPVPHPSVRNAAVLPGIAHPPAKAPRGAK
jgi:hypothetical protein